MYIYRNFVSLKTDGVQDHVGPELVLPQPFSGNIFKSLAASLPRGRQ